MTPLLSVTLFFVLPWTGTFEFLARAHEYVETHRRLAAGIEQPLCADPEELTRQARALATAIHDARPLAVEGDIFTPAAAVAFRARIADVVRRKDIDVASYIAQDEGAGELLELYVFGTLPWRTGDVRWVHVVRELPVLPEELEYGFVGPHLALVDVPANLIVDVLRDALPVAGARSPARRGPCDVHPEMPRCWM
jgi:hypothetical protein